jgi:HAD superfamily hydrolase (TIGR01509 family)
LIKAVLFDLFETLITESRLQPTRASRLGETLGCEQEAFRAAWKAQRPRVVLGQLSFAGALTEISTTVAGTVDAAAIQRACDQRIREKAAAYAQIDEEVAALIDELRGCGIALAVISNCFQEDVLEWPTCPLARGFQSALFSCAEGVAKPDPDIYLRATRRLGVEPATAVFIGDGGDNELAGAERAGVRAFRALWFTGDRLRDRWPETPRLSNRQDVLKLVGAR